MTFETVDGLKEEFDRARREYERLCSHLESDENVDVDFVEEAIGRQSERIERLEDAEALRDRYEQNNPEDYRDRVDALESLREKTETLIEEEMDSLEDGLESLDRMLEVMDHYEPNKGESYYLDETI